MEHLKAIGTLFYVIDPKETMYEKVSDIPKPDFTTRVMTNSKSNFQKFKKDIHIFH